MSYQYNISDIGLRLIKAYEGYAPNGQTMRGGRKLVGYGRITQDMNLKLSESEAETLLLEDLVTIENIVNANVHAAMSQSQFDALCSLAYSIGVDAFLGSDVLHALNRGEIIAAANAFDGWRLGNIDGQIYVVDALVRRRTAEKALFLRPNKTVPAPHDALKALRDDRQTDERVAQSTQTGRESEAPSSNIVPLYNHDDTLTAQITEPKGDADAEIVQLETRTNEDSSAASPIAEAAAEVSERLDALMEDDNTDAGNNAGGNDWPESLVQDAGDDFDPSDIQDRDDFFDDTSHLEEARFVEDDLVGDNVDGGYASADKYIDSHPSAHKQQNFWAYMTMIILGLTMTGGGLMARMNNNQVFGDISRLAWSAVFAIGVLMLIMGLYYLAKQLFGKS